LDNYHTHLSYKISSPSSSLENTFDYAVNTDIKSLNQIVTVHPPQTNHHLLLEKLRGAYSDNTLRAYKMDFDIYCQWCLKNVHNPLPTSPEAIAKFIDQQALHYAPATIRRRVSSIGRIHKLIDRPDPTQTEQIRLALRRMHRQCGRRQKQALGLTAEIRDKLIAAASNDIAGLRDQIVVSLAYDTLRRRSELVNLLIEDIEPVPQGGATILVRRSKSDQEGVGTLAYISPPTLALCQKWIKLTLIVNGPILRKVSRYGTIGLSLYSGNVGRIIKSLASKAGLPEETVKNLSGHSARVGAAQDMAAAGIDLIAIMQAGGWKTPSVVARYIENLDILRGGGFQLAMLQNRK
jgi:integrase/recombinase XerD